ncbi:MAG TPA: hypothetical protein VKV16_04460 [Solirubrobacteraceae bacterium]|nr:hypothetical protein [Solirubrobacteraceae bacterium]
MPEPTSRAHVFAAGASPEEAAAIVAAIERFVRATAPAPAACAPPPVDGWHAAALLEGVERGTGAALVDAWLARQS